MLVEVQRQALSRHNNFDLIRLLAAYQVVAMHSGEHLQIAVPGVLTFFPGVPIFFIVSGFLVTASLAHCGSLAQYARNRVLRIYPALWAMTAVTLLLLAAFGQIGAGTPKIRLLAYVLGQCTIFQIVDGGLGMFRSWGTGAVNGALWTIATELQFYVCLPLMFMLANRFPRRRLWVLLALAVASVALYQLELPAWTDLTRDHSTRGSLALTVLYTSLPTHLFGFMIGMFAYLKLPALLPLVRGRFIYWALVYGAFVMLMIQVFDLAGWALEKNVVAMLAQRLLLAGLILSAAFSAEGLTHKLLRGNDISYGVYVYHMLVINSLIQLGYYGAWPHGLAAATITALVAFASWRCVERPALGLKRRRAELPRAAAGLADERSRH